MKNALLNIQKTHLALVTCLFLLLFTSCNKNDDFPCSADKWVGEYAFVSIAGICTAIEEIDTSDFENFTFEKDGDYIFNPDYPDNKLKVENCTVPIDGSDYEKATSFFELNNNNLINLIYLNDTEVCRVVYRKL